MLAIAIFGGLIFGITPYHTGMAQDGPVPQPSVPYQSLSTSNLEGVAKIYIPVAPFDFPKRSLFGAETYGPLHSESPLLGHANSLSVGWLRLGRRISWRTLQPYPGAPIQWELQASFEQELYQLREKGISPVVIISDSPLWATNGKTGSDGKPSTCAAIRPERLSDYAAFIRAVVNRYKAPEFNVHNWELGNEPDVDPRLVPGDSGFGCWGDESDPYYGGKQYGEMLKVVTPAIKGEDPDAQVWIGGLLLAAPATTSPSKSALRVYPELLERGITSPVSPQSHPETFFKGILESGAGTYFDIVAYHWYPSYYQGDIYPAKIDYDLKSGQSWDKSGGGVVGKAKFLRNLMKQYGISKPLSLNETGLGCLIDRFSWCNPPEELFYLAQANYLVRSFVRGLPEEVLSFSWYTIEDEGWRYLGLLDGEYNPRPNYTAYLQLVRELKNARLIGPVDYGEKIEAYGFEKDGLILHILWAREDQLISLRIPSSRYVAARTRDGFPIPPSTLDSDNIVTVGFDPVYLTLRP
jgi:hypothetical protein